MQGTQWVDSITNSRNEPWQIQIKPSFGLFLLHCKWIPLVWAWWRSCPRRPSCWVITAINTRGAKHGDWNCANRKFKGRVLKTKYTSCLWVLLIEDVSFCANTESIEMEHVVIKRRHYESVLIEDMQSWNVTFHLTAESFLHTSSY